MSQSSRTARGGVLSISMRDCVDAGAAQALCDVAESIEHDDSVRVVVLNASARALCFEEESDDSPAAADWVEAIARITRPVIVVIHGDAVAEGLEMALACDLRVVADDACFAMPQVCRGGLPHHGGTQRLSRLVGASRALDLLLSGRRIDAREALAIGLVSRVVPRRRLTTVASQLAQDLAARAPIALRYAKEAVMKGTDMTLDQGVRLEQDLYVLLQTTSDRAHGVRTFLNKKTPRFRGR